MFVRIIILILAFVLSCVAIKKKWNASLTAVADILAIVVFVFGTIGNPSNPKSVDLQNEAVTVSEPTVSPAINTTNEIDTNGIANNDTNTADLELILYEELLKYSEDGKTYTTLKNKINVSSDISEKIKVVDSAGLVVSDYEINNGEVVISNVPVGIYKISIELEGYLNYSMELMLEEIESSGTIHQEEIVLIPDAEKSVKEIVVHDTYEKCIANQSFDLIIVDSDQRIANLTSDDNGIINGLFEFQIGLQIKLEMIDEVGKSHLSNIIGVNDGSDTVVVVFPDYPVIKDEKGDRKSKLVDTNTPMTLEAANSENQKVLYDGYNISIYPDFESISIEGVKYTNGFFLRDYYGIGIALFNLSGKYSKVSFLVGRLDNQDLKNQRLKIYLDDGDSPYKEYELSANSSKSIEIDGLENVNYLRLELVGSSSRYGFVDFLLYPDIDYNESEIPSDSFVTLEEVDKNDDNVVLYDGYNLQVFPKDFEDVWVGGKKYNNGFVLRDYYGEGRALFNLSRRYSKMTFYIGRVANNDLTGQTLKVYLDNGDSPYATYKLSPYKTYEFIEIENLDEVNSMYFVLTGSSSRYGFVDCHLYPTRNADESAKSSEGYKTLEDVNKDEDSIVLYDGNNKQQYPNDYNEVWIGGKKYTNGFILRDYYGVGKALFNLSKKYSKIEFTVGRLDHYDLKGQTLKIYRDEEEAPYKTYLLSAYDTSITIELDELDDVKNMRFELIGSSSKYGFVDFHLFEK